MCLLNENLLQHRLGLFMPTNAGNKILNEKMKMYFQDYSRALDLMKLMILATDLANHFKIDKHIDELIKRKFIYSDQVSSTYKMTNVFCSIFFV